MTAPRLTIDLGAITANARTLVARLAPRGIRVTGVAKAVCGLPAVAEAMLLGGASGIGDSRIRNLLGMRDAGAGVDVDAPLTLIRSPMLSEVEAVARAADHDEVRFVVLGELQQCLGERLTHQDVGVDRRGGAGRGPPSRR